jgi:glyoxylase-like metal-dependent hydrolase (beta-lactamase superfamily II)/rhodanese-related sulfurtransferase
MIFRQFIDEDLGCASYLLGDAGEAAIVDPAWDTGKYLDFADAHNLRITRVAETHTHADHVSGRGRLAAATGAELLVPAAADADFPHTRLKPGDSFAFGDISVEVVDTAGHRPEHLAFLVTDRGRSAEPTILLSGDSLLVGDVARPDLAAGDSEAVDAAARSLFASIRRLAALPDHVELWPGHIGGSLCCSAGTSEKPSSTVAHERRTNAALAVPNELRFVTDLRRRLPERPPTVDRIVGLNRGPLVSEQPPLAALTAREVADAVAAGATIVDGRSAEAFDNASIDGSLCIPLHRPGAGTRAAWLLHPDTPIVLVADDAALAEQLASRLGAVGLFEVRGYLLADIASWQTQGLPLRIIERVSAPELAHLLAVEAAVLVDVRDVDEHARLSIPGALHVPWRELPARAEKIRDIGKPIAVACASGRRTAIAASLLATHAGPPVLRLADEGIHALHRYSSEPGALTESS